MERRVNANQEREGTRNRSNGGDARQRQQARLTPPARPLRETPVKPGCQNRGEPLFAAWKL